MLNAMRPYQNEFQNAVRRGYLDSLNKRERAKMDEYIKAREYYDGVHQTQLTDRLRQFLNVTRDANFTVNYCPMVVDAKADRLNVTGFDTEGDQQDTLWRWWRMNRMDRKQGIVHRAAVRDGDAFLLVEWDSEADLPRFHFEPAYAGDGVMVYYSEERRDEIAFASKTWRIEHGVDAGKMRRKNLYFPDRIEKYVSKDGTAAGNWMPYNDPNDDKQVIMPGYIGMTAVNWWTDGGKENGKPLGVPIVHFKHNDTGDSHGTSHLANVMPVQDAVNKAMIDLLAATDSAGFGMLVGYGTDKWSETQVGPGAIASTSKKPDEAKLERVPGDNPTNLLQVYNSLVMEIARISGTPLSYFQLSGQVAAEGTLKQQEVALLSQVQKSQVDFGNSWEDCMMIARRLHNAFSEQPELDDAELIDTIWEDAETRNDKEKAETLDILVNKLGVSEEQAQIELGYDRTQIASFQRAGMRQMALRLRNNARASPGENAQTGDTDETLTQTEADDDTAGTQAA